MEEQEIQTGQEAPINEPAPLPSLEDQARDMGWRPREEYEGDPNKWVDASIFVARAPLFDKIDELKRHNKTLERGIEALKQHQTKLSEAAYRKAMNELKAEKQRAAAEGDLEKLEEVRDQMQELRENQIAAPEPATAQPPPEFVNWQNENKWYETDEDMRAFADGIGVKLHQRGLSPDQVLKEVSERVKKAFPQKFSSPARQRPSAVDASGTPAPKKASEPQLSAEQRQVMNRFIAAGIMTKEEYLKELKDMEG